MCGRPSRSRLSRADEYRCSQSAEMNGEIRTGSHLQKRVHVTWNDELLHKAQVWARLEAVIQKLVGLADVKLREAQEFEEKVTKDTLDVDDPGATKTPEVTAWCCPD